MTIRLRPVRPDDVETLVRWREDPESAGEFQWIGFGSTRNFRDAVADDTLLDDSSGTLAVVDDDVLCGDVSWRQIRTGASPLSFCWNIGIVLLPEHRGKGIGSTAQRLLADYLFAHTSVQRVEADTDLGNVAEQRALEKAGFTREGVLRRTQWRNGDWRDMVMYSKLRGEA
jgi:RimJ/RimL family protein N-acetyltransferase